MVVSGAVETNFLMDCLVMSHHAKAMARKANRPSHGPRALAKARAKTPRDKETGNPKFPRVPKLLTKVKTRKVGCPDTACFQSHSPD